MTPTNDDGDGVKPRTVHLSDQLWRRLRTMAAEDGSTVSALLEAAVERIDADPTDWSVVRAEASAKAKQRRKR